MCGVNPKATRRFIEAYWSAHILDWSNLDMNRTCFFSDAITKQQDVAKLLVEKCADISIKDKEGRSALWWAEDLGWDDAAGWLKQANQKKVGAGNISKD